MTKSHYKEQVGDVKSPALRPEESALRAGVDQAALIQADTTGPAAKINAMAGLACAVSKYSEIPRTTCKQIIWFSFFFDGTGNNLEADEGMSKHSNVAKLFRVHKEFDKDKGVYPIDMPDVGTYFAGLAMMVAGTWDLVVERRAGGGLKHHMPFSERFWRDDAVFDEPFTWDAKSRATETRRRVFKDLLLSYPLPVTWTEGENNVSGMNLSVLADNSVPREDGRALASVNKDEGVGVTHQA